MLQFNPEVLPANFRREYDRLSPAAQERWLEERNRGLTDQIFLGSEIMGMDFQVNPHEGMFSLFLKKEPGTSLFDLDPQIKKRMILWPRGTFKTSALVVEIVQLILNYPNIRILYMSGSKDLARRQIARVKRIFENPTEKFRKLFPDFCGEKLGIASEFSVPCRTLDHLAEPTLALSTAKSVNASSHFDVIFVDDLVHEKNYRNPKLLEATIEDYRNIGPLLQPSGYMYVTGTRYSYADTYQYIQDKAKEEMRQTGKSVWKFSIRTCWIKTCKTCGHPDVRHDSDKSYSHPPCTICICKGFIDSGKKEVLFPQFRTRDGRTEGHTVEFLESELREKGGEWFSCQYLNSPQSEGTQIFTRELIHAQTFYQLRDLPTQGAVFIVGDLSYVGDDDRDQSVLYVCRQSQGRIFAFDCIAGKWNSSEVADQLLLAMQRYRPRIIYLERFLGYEAYDTVFQMKARDRGILRLPVEWIKMSNVTGAKKLRIGAIQGVLSQKRLWMFAGMPFFELLCEQLERWPKLGKHDDFADCLGLVCQVPTGYFAEQLPQAETAISWLRKLNTPKDEESYDSRIPGSY